jgi:LEA14-like dessication related protein
MHSARACRARPPGPAATRADEKSGAPMSPEPARSTEQRQFAQVWLPSAGAPSHKTLPARGKASATQIALARPSRKNQAPGHGITGTQKPLVHGISLQQSLATVHACRLFRYAFRTMQRRAAIALLAAALIASACSKPQPPRVTPVAARVKTVTPAGLVLSIDLDVYNPNGFPLVARSVTGRVEIGNGVELGRGSATPAGSIPANGSSRVTTELNIAWTNAPALAPLALSEKPVPYTFRGVATIGGERLNVDVPFVVKGALTRAQVLQAGLRGFGGMGLPLP